MAASTVATQPQEAIVKPNPEPTTDKTGTLIATIIDHTLPIAVLLLGALAFAAACYYGPRENYPAPAFGIAAVEMWMFIHVTQGLPGRTPSRITAALILLAALAYSFL